MKDILFIPFFYLMKIFSRNKKKLYWRQRLLNVQKKGGTVVDETGKEIVIPGTKIFVSGKGNVISINKNIEISQKGIVSITVYGDNNKVDLADIGVDGRLNIIIGSKDIKVRNVTVQIGEKTGFCSTTIETYNSNNLIKIGKKCMFSFGINLYNTDGHPVYDRETGRLINQIKELIIGDHVWICADALILKNTVIPNDCIIARKSVVTGKHFSETNCLIAGNPATVKKRNICWNAQDPAYTQNAKEKSL